MYKTGSSVSSWGEERPAPSINVLCFTTEAAADPLLECTVIPFRLSGLFQIGCFLIVVGLKRSGLTCKLMLLGSLHTTGIGQAQSSM